MNLSRLALESIAMALNGRLSDLVAGLPPPPVLPIPIVGAVEAGLFQGAPRTTRRRPNSLRVAGELEAR
jgi:hypothetical protein